MVLESLISPRLAERRPWELFFIGIFYSTIAMFLSLWIFQEQASLVMVFLTVLACVPLMYKTMRFEESKEDLKEIKLLKHHWKALSFFIALFIGFVLSFSVWYVFLPSHLVDSLFGAQTSTINAINAKIHGSATTGSTITAFISSSAIFAKIFSNNVKVLFFCIFFSFFYGAGAIFILTWNASVIATAIGNFVRDNLLSSTLGLQYFTIFSIGIMRYMTHGIFEILAYFMGGLAGGIISVAVVRHEFRDRKFFKVVFDSFDLIVLALAVLFLAGVVEVFVTPYLF